MTVQGRRFLALAGLFAVLDWVAVAGAVRWLETVAKPVTTACLIGVAVTLVPADPRIRRLFVSALAFGLAGDVALLVHGWFALGLAAFAVGHVCYIRGFLLAGGSWPRLVVGLVLVGGVGALLAASVVCEAARTSPVLAGAVVGYLLLLATMAVLAVASPVNAAALGGLLFFVSDALIGWTTFPERHLRWADITIMVTYDLAQALLALSLLALRRRSRPTGRTGSPRPARAASG